MAVESNNTQANEESNHYESVRAEISREMVRLYAGVDLCAEVFYLEEI